MQVIDAPRHRISFGGDWLTAVVFLLGTLLVGLLIVRELRVVPAAVSGSTEPASSVAAVPADAVSVPTLMVGGDHEIKVGDRAADALTQLGASVTLVKQTEERGPIGAREIRSYQLAGTRFILVFEPFERRGELRVAAIYLQ
ncbi:MAG TPA: hypothetical protein VGQ16_02740 [Vicinamibacterales bacterium]|jgi:hypothetical protein|nr:hypothetical protein [Vicinamibacterales bacterium]